LQWKKSIKRAKKWLSKAEVSEDREAISYSLLAVAELQRLRKERVRPAKRNRIVVVAVISVIICLLLVPTTLRDNILLIEKKKQQEQRVYFSFSDIRLDLGDVQYWECVEPDKVSATEDVKVVRKAVSKFKVKRKKLQQKFQVIKLVEVGMRELYKNKGAFTMRKGGN